MMYTTIYNNEQQTTYCLYSLCNFVSYLEILLVKLQLNRNQNLCRIHTKEMEEKNVNVVVSPNLNTEQPILVSMNTPELDL